MPGKECVGLNLHANLPIFFEPLHVITQYPRLSAHSMQSPEPPQNVCISSSSRARDLKHEHFDELSINDISMRNVTSKTVDNGEFEKLIGQLGNTSTPVTPTSFLNPLNITEDQEMFADHFSRTLNKFKAEQEGRVSSDSNSVDSTISISTAHSTHFHSGSSTSYSLVSMPADSVTHAYLDSSAALQPIDTLEVVVGETTMEMKSDSPITSQHHAPSNSAQLSSSNVIVGDSPTKEGGGSVSAPLINAGSGMPPIVSFSPRLAAATPIHTISSQSPYPSHYAIEGQNLRSPTNLSSSSITSRYTSSTPSPPCTTALPTIFSIANSLKEACVEQDSNGSNSNFIPGSTAHIDALPFVINSSVGPCCADPSQTRSTNLQSYPSIGGSAEFNSSRSTPLQPSTPVCLPDDRLPGYMVDHTSTATNGDVMYNSSSVAVMKSDNVNNSRVERNHLLSPTGPIALLVTSSAPALPSMSHTTSSVMLQKVASNGLCPGVAIPDVFGDPNPLITTPAGLSNRRNVMQDPNSGTVLLNQDIPFHQITALYPGIGGAITLTNATSVDGLLTDSGPFLIQSTNPDLGVPGISFLPSRPLTDTALLDASSLRMFQSASLLANGGHSIIQPTLTLSSSPDSCPIHTRKSDQSNYVGNAMNAPRPVDSRLATNSKKTKRAAGSQIGPIIPSKQVVMNADSSTDIQSSSSVPSSLIETSQSRILTSSFNADSFSLTSSAINDTVLITNSSPCSVTTHYLSESREPIKSESDLMDSGSNHSESGYSISNQDNHHNNNHTPPSSSDGLNPSVLKLERKRARNRVAARRCRERKLSLIRTLEDQVAERNVQIKMLEETLTRYRSEGQRLRAHIEILANSYPSLKAELCQFPFLFQTLANQQQPSLHQPPPNSVDTPISADLSRTTHLTPVPSDLSDYISNTHFSITH